MNLSIILNPDSKIVEFCFLFCVIFSRRNIQNKNVQPKSNAAQGLSLISKSSAKSVMGATNIAAVEPYHHVPTIKGSVHVPSIQESKCGNNYRKIEQHVSSVDGVTNHRNAFSYPISNQKESKSSTYDERVPSYNTHSEDEKKSMKDGENSTSDDRTGEYWPNKFDSKYQTLPSGGARYIHTNSVYNSRYDYRKPAEGIENTLTNSHEPVIANQKRLSEDSCNNNSSCNGNSNRNDNNVKETIETNDTNQNCGNNNNENFKNYSNTNSLPPNSNQQQTSLMQQMNIVRSMPIQTTTNKGLATPLSNSNYVPRSNATNLNNFTR